MVLALKQGAVAEWRRLSDSLAILRVLPEPGGRFPEYQAGQYIALRRNDCRLTRRVPDPSGIPRYVIDVDAEGRPKRGPISHSYSISSAPFETARDGHLEFYVVLERDDDGALGRLTESLFRVDPGSDGSLCYYDRITGDFTLGKRAAGFPSVLMVGTGTGLAPFVSMLKQLDHEARAGGVAPVRYTLLHANRTRAELAYHEELTGIAAASAFDFAYVAAVSRPSPADAADPLLGTGRANNLLRHVFEMPLKEQEDADPEAAASATPPRLPAHYPREALRERLDPARTVVLVCGNPASMAEVKGIAERVGMRFEKEDWKPIRGFTA